MAQTLSRRRIIELALVTGGVAAGLGGRTPARAKAQSAMPNPMYPDHYLKVLGFFEEQDRDWYEKIHALDFMSFAAPYMARYARNWIEDVEAGETPAFRVITEIQYRNDAAKAEVRRLMNSPAGEPLLEHSLQHRAARGQAAGAGAAPEPLRLFAVEPRVAVPVSSKGAATAPRRVLLLRRSNKASQNAFAAAVAALAHDPARWGEGAAVSFDLFGHNPQAGPADAVVYIANSPSGAVPVSASAALEVISALRVETRVGAG
jgi:hypothetical protein